MVESGKKGFIHLYSGSSDEMPSAFGVTLASVDEVCHHIELGGPSALPIAAEASQRELFDRQFAALPGEVQAEITKLYGHPRIFMLWSTS